MSFKHWRIVVKMDGLAGQSHLAVDLDPVRIIIRQNLAHGLSDHFLSLQAGEPFKGWVDLQEAVIAGLAIFVADNLMQGETLGHPAEQGAVALFAGPQSYRRFHALPDFTVELFVGLG